MTENGQRKNSKGKAQEAGHLDHGEHTLDYEETWISHGDKEGVETERPRLLLHSCCGPCSTWVIESLRENFEITVFFYNPNITDKEEYDRRLEAQKKVLEVFENRWESPQKIQLLVGEFEVEKFYAIAQGNENCPEGGARCQECFKLRLEKTAEMAAMLGFDTFGTTLTISPHKEEKIINNIGLVCGQLYGVSFLERDFKKKEGFKKSAEMSKAMGIYRQNYCGCQFSKKGQL